MDKIGQNKQLIPEALVVAIVFVIAMLLQGCGTAASTATTTEPTPRDSGSGQMSNNNDEDPTESKKISIEAAQTPKATVETGATTSMTATNTPTPLPMPSPTATTTLTPTVESSSFTLQDVEHYHAYRVQEGDTIASISEKGGSTPDVLMLFNRIDTEPQVGREMLVPQLLGKTSILTDTPMMVLKGNTKERWIGYTIDCGKFNEHTDKMLDILKENNVHATFFVHGDAVYDDPDIVRRMIADGHEIGSHSYTHPNFKTLTDEEIADQLQRTAKNVQEILGDGHIEPHPYFRFPFGESDDDSVLAVIANGYIPIHWNLFPGYELTDPDEIVETFADVMDSRPPENLPGSILLTHCTEEDTVALPSILKILEEYDLEGHTVTDVLGP